MTEQINIRPATKNDAPIIAKLMLESSGGIIEYLVTDLMPGMSPLKIMQWAVSGKSIPDSYLHTTIYEQDDEVVGITHGYPGSYNKVPSQADKSPVPFEKLDYILTPLYRIQLENSWFINTIAVTAQHHDSDLKKLLLDNVKQSAQEQGYDSVYRYVWADNIKAIELFQSEGYKVVENIDIKRQDLLPHDGGMVLQQLLINK